MMFFQKQLVLSAEFDTHVGSESESQVLDTVETLEHPHSTNTKLNQYSVNHIRLIKIASHFLRKSGTIIQTM